MGRKDGEVVSKMAVEHQCPEEKLERICHHQIMRVLRTMRVDEAGQAEWEGEGRGEDWGQGP